MTQPKVAVPYSAVIDLGAPGLALGDLAVLAIDEDGVVSDPGADLGLLLIEVDAVLAPDLYWVWLTPKRAGRLLARLQYLAVTVDLDYYVEPADYVEDSEGELQLTVTDGTNPLQGVSVRVFLSSSSAVVTTAITDSVGEVVLSLPVGTYDVRLYKQGYSFSNPTEVEVEANEDTAPVLLEILPTAAASGEYVVLRGRNFSVDSSTVTFNSTAATPVGVSPDGRALLVEVNEAASMIYVRVRKPDPAIPGGLLYSNRMTLLGTP